MLTKSITFKTSGRFGRYPHRNELLGRESTEEEAAYLSDIDSLHDWEKSQTKK